MPGNVLSSGEMVCSHDVYDRVEDTAVKNDYMNNYLTTIVINAKKGKVQAALRECAEHLKWSAL